MPRLLVIVGLVIALAGCGGNSDGGSETRLPTSVASDLAGRSEAVARLVESGDGCGALRQSRSLARAVARGLQAGSIPAVLGEEIDTTVEALIGDIDCETAATPTPATVETTGGAPDEQESGGNDDKKKDKKNKQGNRHENGQGNDDKGKD